MSEMDPSTSASNQSVTSQNLDTGKFSTIRKISVILFQIFIFKHVFNMGYLPRNFYCCNRQDTGKQFKAEIKHDFTNATR